MGALSDAVRRPWRDLTEGLDGLIGRGDRAALARVFAGLLLGWWIYVPVHELSHAAACWLVGGEVSRLEVAPLYGGTLLAGWLPWVVSGSEYAGRLSGFDTHGSDLRYLATDLGPFVWTFAALPLLLLAARRGAALIWGLLLPWAFSPFLSLTGDAYEIGSIVLTRLSPWSKLASVIRGDDVFKVWAQVREAGALGISGWLLAAVAGVVWAFSWYAFARLAAGGEPRRSG